MISDGGFVVPDKKVLEKGFFWVKLVDNFENLLDGLVFIFQMKLSDDFGYFV